MSLSSTSNRVVATGDNLTVTFNYNRLLYDTTHLQVYLAGALQSSGYTVNGVPGTSTSVTFSVAPGTDVQVLLLRVVPLTQLSDYGVGGAFPSESVEKSFDLEVMGLQQFDEVLGRAITLPVSSTLTATNIPDPSLAANFGKGLKIKGDGTGIDTYELSATPFTSPLTTKGDLAVYSSAADRLPVGTNGQTLQADSTTGTGHKWTGDQPDNVFRVVGSADATKKVALEVDGLTTATTRTVTIQDEDGTLALTSEFAYSNLAGAPGRAPLPPKHISGYTFANNVGDATNDLDIAAGSCRDATDAHNLIGAALTKQSDVAWAVGNNAGMLDTGAVGNSDYYIWAIKRSDTGVVDYLSSLSSTAPTMPTNYDFKRLIGWFKRSGGSIVAFHTYEIEGGGLELSWDSPTLDIDLAATLTTSRRTDAVKVPLNFSVRADLNVVIRDGSVASVWIYNPDQADLAPSYTATPLANQGNPGVTGSDLAIQMKIRTSTTGTIAARASLATIDNYKVVTLGFTWARRN